MSERHIAFTPDNYLLCYEYFAGNIDTLETAFETLLEKEAEPSADALVELYHRFFVRNIDEEERRKLDMERSAISDVGEKTDKILKPLARDLTTLSDTQKSYGKRLEHFTKNLPAMDGNIEKVLFELASETKKIANSNKGTVDNLNQYGEKLADLREKLSKARAEARLDDLTKTENRRAFNEMIAGADESLAGSSLAIIDIDHFKLVNDNFGHPIGDRLLVAIADMARESIRESDRLFRYGGEEFAILLLGTSLAAACERLEQVRDNIEKHDFSIRGKKVPITVSGGVSLLDTNANMNRAVQLADDSLYLAKKMGRNNIKSEKDLLDAKV